MRINNIKLELKIKKTKQVKLANRQEAASVSVHERAKHWRDVRGSARRRWLLTIIFMKTKTTISALTTVKKTIHKRLPHKNKTLL